MRRFRWLPVACPDGGVGVATLLLVLESAAWAQVPDPLSPPLLASTLQSVRAGSQQERQTEALEADRNA